MTTPRVGQFVTVLDGRCNLLSGVVVDVKDPRTRTLSVGVQIAGTEGDPAWFAPWMVDHG